MRLIVRKERPHPGAQLRITDADGMRITCFATNTPNRPIAELELRHRLRVRAEDRIRAARATGLTNLPLHHTAQNKVWLEIVQIALDLLAWMPMLALTGKARLWEPRRLRFRLFSAAAQLVTTGRRRILRLTQHWPWTGEITGALERSCATTKLLVDGFSTKITRVRQELRVLVYPSSIDLSSRTLRFLTGQLTVRRPEIGTRWRRLPAARQALLALAHLRCGDTYAQLAAGFGIGIATVYRYIHEAVEALSALARTGRNAAYRRERC